MERILTKEEIKDLIAAVRQGNIEVDSDVPSPKSERKAISFDLTQSHGAGPRRLPNVDLILDAFAQNFAVSMGKRLERSVLVKRTAIDTLVADQFMHAFTDRGSIGVIRLDPLRWGGLVTFDQNLSFYLVETLLGGGGEERLNVPERSLTNIEKHVVKPVFSDICPDLAKALRSVVELAPDLAKVESNMRLINVFPADAVLMVARFTVSVGTLTAQMNLVIPYASLEPLMDKLRGGGGFSIRRNNLWRPHLEAELEQMETRLTVQLGVVNLQVRDILNFQVGDIIDLGSEPSAPLRVTVGGKLKFLSQAGLRNGRKSIRIIGSIKKWRQ